MKHKIYEGKGITIYKDKEMEVGEEMDIGFELIEIGLAGLVRFSHYLEENKTFLKDTKKIMRELMIKFEKMINE